MIRPSADSVLTKFLYKTLDAVMTANVRLRQTRSQSLSCLFSLRSSRYDRVAAVVNLVESLFPGAAGRASKRLLRPDAIPFATTRFKALNFGSGSTVFLMDTMAGQTVLKVYRRTIS